MMQLASSEANKILFNSDIEDVHGVAPVIVDSILDFQRLVWLYV